MSVATYCRILNEVENEWLRTELIVKVLPYKDAAEHKVVAQTLRFLPDALTRQVTSEILTATPTPASIGLHLQDTVQIHDQIQRINMLASFEFKVHPSSALELTDIIEKLFGKIDAPNNLLTLCTRIISTLDKDKRLQILEDILVLTASIIDQFQRAEALINLLQSLQTHEQGLVINQILDTIFSINNKEQRTTLLTKLVEAIRLQLDDEMSKRAIAFVLTLEDVIIRTNILIALLPKLENYFAIIATKQLQNDLKELEGAESRTRAYICLLPHLHGERRVAAFHHAMSACHAINDTMIRVTLFTKIAEVKIAPHAFATARSIALSELTGKQQAIAIASLIPLANGIEQRALLRKGLHIALRLKAVVERAEALSHYLPFVKNREPILMNIRQAVWETLKEKSKTFKRAELFDYLASDRLFHLSQFSDETLLGIVKVTSEICDEWMWL